MITTPWAKRGLIFLSGFLVVSVVGCHFAHYPFVVNGYDVPVRIRRVERSHPPGLSMLYRPGQVQSEPVAGVELQSITVSSAVLGIPLAHYGKLDLLARTKGHQEAARIWIVSEKGLQLVPREYLSNWKNYLKKIKQSNKQGS